MRKEVNGRTVGELMELKGYFERYYGNFEFQKIHEINLIRLRKSKKARRSVVGTRELFEMIKSIQK